MREPKVFKPKKPRPLIPNVIPRYNKKGKQVGSITFDPESWRVTHLTTLCTHTNYFVYAQLDRLQDWQLKKIQSEVYSILHSLGFKKGVMPPVGWNLKQALLLNEKKLVTDQ